MKSKGGRNQPAQQPAPAPAPAQQSPASPTGKGAKYRNRDGSKFITLPDTTSAPNSAQPSPTSPTPSNAKSPAAPTAAPAVNRKKQKRREKAAAKAAAMAAVNGASGPSSSTGHERTQELDPADENDDDGDPHDRQGSSQQSHPQMNGHADEPSGKSKKAKKKKKKGAAGAGEDDSSTVWNTSSAAERERIKEFWLDLREEERKSLVKVEKDAVLKKMKEQQKHTCSCSVCGRKRNAIEEELEGLYDAYYLELEQFANHPQQDGQPPLLGARPFGFPPSSRFSSYAAPQPSRGRIVEQLGEDEEDDDDDDELDEPYSDEDLDDDEPYSDDEPVDNPRDYASDFFNFGSSLTVQGMDLFVFANKLVDMEQLITRCHVSVCAFRWHSHGSRRSFEKRRKKVHRDDGAAG